MDLRRVTSQAVLWGFLVLGVLPATGCRTFDATDWLVRRERHEIMDLRIRHEAAQVEWAPLHFAAGRFALTRGDMPPAFHHLQAASRMMPDWDLPYLELAALHPIWDHDQEAELAALRRAVAIKPDNPRTRLMLGIVLIRMEHLEEAEEHLLAALERRDLPEARWRLGNLYQRTDRPAQAVLQYDRLLSSQPDNAALHALLAELHETQGNSEKAESHLLTLCRLNPHQARSFLLLGSFYQRQGRVDEARSALEQAERLNPSQPRRRHMRPLPPSPR